MHLSPPLPGGLGCCPFLGGGSVVVDIMFNALPIVCESSVLFCYALLCVNSSFAIILNRKSRSKLVAMLLLSYRCSVTIDAL